MGLAADTWSDGQVDTLRTMWAAGYPVKTIAAKIGKSTTAVKSHRARIGLPARSQGDTVNLRVAVSESLLVQIRSRAANKGMSIVGYVHSLFVEDLSGSSEQ